MKIRHKKKSLFSSEVVIQVYENGTGGCEEAGYPAYDWEKILGEFATEKEAQEYIKFHKTHELRYVKK